MTTITPPRILDRRNPARRRAGISLVEVMVGATLAAFILAGVLSSFLFLGRSGANIRNYSDMETQARTALELFAEDVRQASSITWNTSTDITLRIPAGAGSVDVQYAYVSGSSSLTRTTATGTRTVISGISAGSFQFKAYAISGASLPLVTNADRTAAGINTKQLQISLEATRTNRTVVAATNTVLSARFILRNKIITA